MLTNCDIWTIVDFGKGPVEVRCTELGLHEDHRCEVFIEVDREVLEGVPIQFGTRQNIFDKNEFTG